MSDKRIEKIPKGLRSDVVDYGWYKTPSQWRPKVEKGPAS